MEITIKCKECKNLRPDPRPSLEGYCTYNCRSIVKGMDSSIAWNCKGFKKCLNFDLNGTYKR